MNDGQPNEKTAPTPDAAVTLELVRKMSWDMAILYLRAFERKVRAHERDRATDIVEKYDCPFASELVALIDAKEPDPGSTLNVTSYAGASWNLVEEFGEDAARAQAFDEAAKMVEVAKTRPELVADLRNKASGTDPDEQLLATASWDILTNEEPECHVSCVLADGRRGEAKGLSQYKTRMAAFRDALGKERANG